MLTLPLLTSPTTAALAATLAGALFASFWQGSLLVLLVAAGLRLFPGLPSAARSAVWAAVLLLIVGHPVFLLAGHAGAAPSVHALHVPAGASLALVSVWALASLFRLFQLLISAAELWRTLRSAQPIAATPGIAALLRQSARKPQLCSSAMVHRPCVAGFWRPRLLLPTDLLAVLNEAELRQIVLHELEHLRRGDDWVNLLQGLALVILPVHPALFWLNRRLAFERELACDDAVLSCTRAHTAYAACLAHVAEQSLQHSLLRRGLSLALGTLGNTFGSLRRRSDLTQRVERILRRPEHSLSGFPLRFATALTMAGTLAAGGLLAHTPAWVSFAPVTSASPFASASASFPGATPLRVNAVYRSNPFAHSEDVAAGEARATLLKAVLPPTRSNPPARASLHRASLVKVGVRRREPRISTAPRIVWTTWHLASTDETDFPSPKRFQQPRLQVVDQRLVPAVVETRQVWYTAIRYGDGWLLVQL